jgi:hypothetical protein
MNVALAGVSYEVQELADDVWCVLGRDDRGQIVYESEQFIDEEEAAECADRMEANG